MGTLLYPHEGYAHDVLDMLFLKYQSISTKKFRETLVEKHPDYDWTFLWCSKFLMQNCSYLGDGADRHWYLKGNVFEEEFKKLLEEPISKKNLRKECDKFDLRQDRFNMYFNMYAKWTGTYNKENHKLYYLKAHNASFKESSKADLEYLILESGLNPEIIEPGSKLHQLLKSYFTYDSKQCL